MNNYYHDQLVLSYQDRPKPLDSRLRGNDGSPSEYDKFIWSLYYNQ